MMLIGSVLVMHVGNEDKVQEEQQVQGGGCGAGDTYRSIQEWLIRIFLRQRKVLTKSRLPEIKQTIPYST